MAASALGLLASASHASDGLTLAVKGGFLNVTPITDRIVRVQFSRSTDESESCHTSRCYPPNGAYKANPTSGLLQLLTLKYPLIVQLPQ